MGPGLDGQGAETKSVVINGAAQPRCRLDRRSSCGEVHHDAASRSERQQNQGDTEQANQIAQIGVAKAVGRLPHPGIPAREPSDHPTKTLCVGSRHQAQGAESRAVFVIERRQSKSFAGGGADALFEQLSHIAAPDELVLARSPFARFFGDTIGIGRGHADGQQVIVHFRCGQRREICLILAGQIPKTGNLTAQITKSANRPSKTRRATYNTPLANAEA